MDPEAYDAYDQLVTLYTSDPSLAARIDEWLDRTETDPTDAAVRRRLIRRGRLRVITVTEGDQDHLILWDLDGDTPVIRYLGPDVVIGNSIVSQDVGGRESSHRVAGSQDGARVAPTNEVTNVEVGAARATVLTSSPKPTRSG